MSAALMLISLAAGVEQIDEQLMVLQAEIEAAVTDGIEVAPELIASVRECIAGLPERARYVAGQLTNVEVATRPTKQRKVRRG